MSTGPAWRKSTYSQANGNCVECAPEPGTVWRKATASNGHSACVEVAGWQTSSHSMANGNCVQVALRPENRLLTDPVETPPRGVYVRDSKNPDGGVLTFVAADWQAFTARVKTGEYAIA